MKIKELKEILDKYEDNLEVYLEFPARYKPIDADRITINNIKVDVAPLDTVLAGKTVIIFLTGEE